MKRYLNAKNCPALEEAIEFLRSSYQCINVASQPNRKGHYSLVSRTAMDIEGLGPQWLDNY